MPLTTPLILAIEPDKRQAGYLTSMARHALRAEIILADSAERGLARLGDRVPDLILTPALLSPKDDAAIAERLRQLDTRATHVQTLTVPVLCSPRGSSPARGMLAALRRDRSSSANVDGCDPAVFAEQVAAYLERAAAERTAHLAHEEQAQDDVRELRIRAAKPEAPIAATPEPLFRPAEPVPLVAAEFESFIETEPDPAIAALVAETEPYVAVAPEPIPVADPYVAVTAPEPIPVPDPYIAVAPELIPVPDPYVAVAAPEPAVEPEVVLAVAPTPVIAVVVPEPLAAAAPTEPPIAAASRDPLPLEFLVSDLELPAIELPELVAEMPEIVELAAHDEAISSLDSQTLSLLGADAFPILDIVGDEFEGEDATALDEIDLAPLLDDSDGLPLDPFEPTGAAAIMAAVAAIERSMTSDAPAVLEQDVELWMPLRFESHLVWPVLEGVEVEPPSSMSALAPAAIAEVTTRQASPLKRKKTRTKPVQDEWGFFDPAQCGFAALLAKLEEITEKEDARSA